MTSTPNKVNVRGYIKEVGIKHPDIVYAQAIVETGWFKCKHCSMERNNIFGFQTKKGYITFDDWKESVDYYKRWQDKYYSDGNYYDFLECLYETNSGRCVRYATDSTYTNKLKLIVNDFKYLKE